MGESNMSVEQQPKPNVLEQSPSQKVGFASRLAEARLSARTIVPRVTLSLIDERLDKLNRRPGLLKIPTNTEKQRLERQRASIQAMLQGKTEAESEINFPDFKQELFHAKLGQEIKTVSTQYENLLEEILQDGTTTAEIMEGYINTANSPFEGIGLLGRNDQRLKSFYSAFSNLDKHREDSEVQKKTYMQSLVESLPWLVWSGYSGHYGFFPKGHFEDKELIKSMLAKIAANDIAVSIGNKISWIVSNTTSFSKALLLQKYSGSSATSFVDVILFQALKSSKSANEIFGEEIKSQDQEYCTVALNKSLSDSKGEYVGLLYFYPTPEAIRNLVILASSDDGSKRIVAGFTLKNLTKRADWEELLSKAEEVYPALKTVGPLLSESKYFKSSETYHIGYSDVITEKSQDLILSVVEDSSSDPTLKELSTEALTAHSVLGILIKRGVIQASEVTMLNKILEQPNGEDQLNPYDLRMELSGLLQGDYTTEEANQRLEIIRRFEALSLITHENKSDSQAEAYLTDQSVLQKLVDPSLKQEDVDIFLEAYKIVPNLTFKLGGSERYTINNSLLRAFIDQFRGDETIQLFSDLNDAFGRTDKLLTENPELEINENNWRPLLLTFVGKHGYNFLLSGESRKKIDNFFENSRVKDFCLNKLRKEYADYLSSSNPGQIPSTLFLVGECIKKAGGTGHLTQIDSLSSFFNAYCASLDQGDATDEYKNTILQKMHAIEIRFDKEKWSNEERTNFYNMSTDILKVDPNLFFNYLELCNNLSPSDLKSFMREIYPLIGVQLALMEKTDDEGKKTYNHGQLVNLRKNFQAFSISIMTKENPLEIQKAKLIREISRLFKDRFGIIKVPKEFTEDNVRSLTNISLYLSNLSVRDATKEAALGYYLSLMLNNKWDDFRKGVEIDPKTFLEPKRAEEIRGVIKKRTELNPLNPENLGISESDIPEFVRILQDETQNVAVGDIETIDVKLNNVILNLRQLEDPDLYPELLDKQRLSLLLSHGNRKVGSVVSKMYQALQNPSKSIQFSEDELIIKEEIKRIAQDNNFDLTGDNIKKHFQEGIRPLSTIVNMLQFVNEAQAEREIENIRQLLKPSQEVMEVFNRLGEEFKPTSGALALSSDLDYLDNIIVKKEGSLKPNEKKLLVEYTGKIRDQVVKLQEIFDKTKDKFSSLKQGSTTTNNQLLKDKLDQIDQIVNAPSTQQAVVSTMTNNLNTIIENMRECLSCTKKGSNNDTNLTFGDSNKFYLYSQSEGQTRGSISDEILFLDPITHQDGTSEMAFVFDRIYGVQTPTILTNQIETVVKKYRQLKQKYPTAKLSIFVTDSAIATAGLSQDMLKTRIQSTVGDKTYVNEEQVEVNVAESAMADHYIEFGGDGRTSGKRDVKGIVIRI